MLHALRRPLLGACAALCLPPLAAAAEESGCAPIRAAAKAGQAAPAMRQLATLPAQGGTSGRTIEMIRIAKVLYINQGGKWQMLPMSMDIADQIASADVRLSECKPTGAETLDGRQTRIYSYTTEGAAGRMWMSEGDQLPRKFVGASGMTVVINYDNVKAPALQ